MIFKFFVFVFIVSIAPEVGAIDFWIGSIDPRLKGGTWPDVTLTVVNIIRFAVWFLYFVGVVLVIYAGFLILISGGDEEKVKKWRNIIIYVIIGLIVVFLAQSIVSFIVWVLDPTDPNAPTYSSGSIT